MLTVATPAVLLAGLEKAVRLVGAASDPAFFFAAAMFATEALAVRSGGAARHGARSLLLATAVFDAMLESTDCTGGASIELAPPMCTMLTTPISCNSTSLAALNIAYLCAATAVCCAKSSHFLGGSLAVGNQAEPFAAMLLTEAIFVCTCIAPVSCAEPSRAMIQAKSFATRGAGAARHGTRRPLPAAVFITEATGFRDGGAARHGARFLLLPTTVFAAMLESFSCTGGASIKLAPSMRTMLAAKATCLGLTFAVFHVALFFCVAAAMLPAQSSFISGSRAIAKHADLFGAMLKAAAIFNNACIAPRR